MNKSVWRSKRVCLSHKCYAGTNGTGTFDLHCGETFDLAALNMGSYFMRSSSYYKSTYQPDVNCSIIFKTRLSDNLKIQISVSMLYSPLLSYQD